MSIFSLPTSEFQHNTTVFLYIISRKQTVMEDEVSHNLESDNSYLRAKAVSMEMENEGSDTTSKRRKSGGVSDVREQFNVVSDENGNSYAQCKHCKNTKYKVEEGNWSTSDCRRHLTMCKAKAYKADVSTKPNYTGEFDQQVYTRLFADAIVTHDYRLSIVEDKMMRKLLEYLNPNVKPISVGTISKEVEALAIARDEVEEQSGIVVDTDCDSVSDA